MIFRGELFSELNGFVLCVPDLERGVDLLTKFTTTDEGDVVTKTGRAIPVMEVETGDYTLIIRSVDQPSQLPDQPRISSSGWVLNVGDEPLCLCGAGYLANWNPDHPKVRRVSISPGWYAVTIDLCDFHIEFVLTPTTTPNFTADVQTSFA